MAEGEFHEAMNLAALWDLPVLFICENNLYAMGTALGLSESQTDIQAKAANYKMPAEAVDGMNVVDVESAARRAVAAIRGTGEPYFLECRTYRFRAHSMFDPQLYRTREEVDEWVGRGPIARFHEWAISAGELREADVAALEEEIAAEISAAVEFAEAGTWEPVENLLHHVGAEQRQ